MLGQRSVPCALCVCVLHLGVYACMRVWLCGWARVTGITDLCLVRVLGASDEGGRAVSVLPLPALSSAQVECLLIDRVEMLVGQLHDNLSNFVLVIVTQRCEIRASGEIIVVRSLLSSQGFVFLSEILLGRAKLSHLTAEIQKQ